MERFSVELATSILHLEMQKEQILKENEQRERLCSCRLRILNNYIHVCQIFFIRFTSRIIKFLEDNNIAKTMITGDLKRWYGIEMYDKLYAKRCISNKMVLLFKLLQDRVDKDFFKAFDARFKMLIKTYEPERSEEFCAEFITMYSEILDWMETHILGILSLKIDCDNIDDSIIEDFKPYLEKMGDKYECKDVVCDTCKFHVDECPSKDVFVDSEEIHLYVTEETMADDMWLIEYFKLLQKYHKNLKDVALIIDYVLFDEDNFLTYTDKNVYRVNTLAGMCKSCVIINYDNVVFGKYKPEIEMYLEENQPKEMIVNGNN